MTSTPSFPTRRSIFFCVAAFNVNLLVWRESEKRIPLALCSARPVEPRLDAAMLDWAVAE